MELGQLQARARAWAQADPDPETAAALTAVADRGDEEALRAALEPPIAFGTGGLRGPVGPGPARMNRATVLRTTWAVIEHIRATSPPDAPVCVGFDARTDSARFARDVVALLVGAGRHVIGWNEPTPTPLVAWAAREAGAAAAIVITASHNPPADNGYKLYGPDGIQIVPPTDAQIQQLIERAPDASELAPPPDADPWGHELVEELGPFARRRYLDQVAELVDAPGPRADLRVVYTAMHGVGGVHVVAALERIGVTDVHPVLTQFSPDGAFPTVAFPNPEEPGALDAAVALATEVGADLILANDPDADRLSVAVPTDDGWRQLTGNEVGVLLADDLLSTTSAPQPLLCATIVSSPWFADVAAHHGARAELTLTGFKWIWTAAHQLSSEGWEPVLGAEESIGYSVGTIVRDKDGVGASVVLVDLARRLAAAGSDLVGRLRELRERDGAWVSTQRSVRREGADGAAQIAAAMQRARTAAPSSLRGRPVTGVVDWAQGAADRPPWLPATDLVEFTLEGGRALIRPSGTEPKCKVYVDLRADHADDASLAAAREDAQEVGRALFVALGLS